MWAYENLANRRIKASDAPSCGAWALLEWARQYRNRFFEQLLPKAMLNKPSEADENVRREEMRIEEIEGILGQMNKKIAEDLAEDLRADVSAAVQERVHEVVLHWSQSTWDHTAVSIADDARVNLEAHICGLVRDCIRAIGPASGGQ
jgi:hypothetical protein